MRVVFMGTPEFAVPSLELLAAHHEVALVVTRPDAVRARGKEQVPSKQAIHDHLRTVFGDAYDAENCIVHGGAVN